MKVVAVVNLALALATASNFNISQSERVPRGRVLDGQDADPTQIPYIVGLEIERSGPKYSWCGGTLINRNWILTAAHCLQDADKIYVLLGASNRKTPDTEISVMAKDIIVHEKFIAAAKTHDIALIKIKSVAFTKHIQAIKLPEKGNSDYTGKKVLVAGWGVTTCNKNSLSDILQWCRMEVMNNDECAKIDKKYVLCSRINKRAVDGARSCCGDSGGPVVLTSNPNVLIGVSSLAAEPDLKYNMDAAATNVQAHLDWIYKNINKKTKKKINKMIKRHKILQH